MTLLEAINVYEFFPERNDYIGMKESDFVNYMVSEKQKQHEIYTGDLECIINTWDLEERALRYSIEQLNRDLLVDFGYLEEKLVTDYDFDSFLDSLNIKLISPKDGVKISSMYSKISKVYTSWNSPYDIIYGYIEEIVNREDLIIEGFEIGDEFFCSSIREKFKNIKM